VTRTDICSVAIGIKCTDGVILATERLLHSKLLVKGANRRIQSVDEHIGMATAGLLADGKHLGGRAREEASSFRENYNDPITCQVSARHSYLARSQIRSLHIVPLLPVLLLRSGPRAHPRISHPPETTS
jgi:20S proteasome alpha/beta subunit